MWTNVNYVNFILNLPDTSEIGNCWMILPDSFGAGYLFDRQMEGRGMLMGFNGGYLGLYKCIYIYVFIYLYIYIYVYTCMFRYDVNGNVMYTLYVMGDVNIMETLMSKKIMLGMSWILRIWWDLIYQVYNPCSNFHCASYKLYTWVIYRVYLWGCALHFVVKG